MTLGGELLHGTNSLKSGEKRNATRLQLSVQFNLFEPPL
jgi:hypothetical protein